MLDREIRRAQGQELSGWFQTELGKTLAGSALDHLSRTLPCRYSDTAVQVGPGGVDFLTRVDSRLRIYIDSQGTSGNSVGVSADWAALPLGRNAVDLFVLVHTLDFASDPRVVLREAATILAPEGCLVVCGLNPFGIWGLCRLIYGHKEKIPWKSNSLPVTRVQDWISLLGLETIGGSMHFYRPPLEKTRVLNRLAFMETAGKRWWPALSGAYILVAQKKTLNAKLVQVGTTPVRLHTRKRLQPVAHGHAGFRAQGLS